MKRVHRELEALVVDSQTFSRAKDIDGLLRTILAMEKWRSGMDDIVCRQIAGPVATRIFYGEELET